MPLRSQSLSLRFLRSPRRAVYLLAVLAGLAALAVAATPRLEIALEEQYKLAAQRPYDASVQNDLGNLLLLAGSEEAAAQAYQRALEIDGRHKRARFNLGLLEQQRGRHEDALTQFETLLELHPNHAWAYYQSGVSLQELDRRKAAMEHYAHAFGLDPTLSFAENNPHIIDNTMVTEALLLSTQYGTAASRSVARQYDEAARLVSMMLEEEVVTEKMDDAGVEKMAKEEMEGEGQPVQRANSRLDSEPVIELEGTESSGEEIQEERARTITEDDLDGGVRVGGAVGVPSAAPTVRRNRPNPRSGGIDLRSSTRRDAESGQAPRSNPNGQRYIPSRRSSASLDLKLLPEDGVTEEGIG